MESYLGTVMSFGFTFAPVGWLQCNGQLLPISEYSALYSLIGTTFGGDGQTNFALPNLQGRIPIGTGQGTGLSSYALGQTAGSENVTLNTNNMPAHTHPIVSARVPVADTANAMTPLNNYFSTADATVGNAYSTESTSGAFMNGGSANTTVAGVGTPFNIVKPFLVINFCICVDGIWPPQS